MLMRVERGFGWHRAAVIASLEHHGAVALGEASPLPGYSPESLEDAEAALVAFARALDPTTNLDSLDDVRSLVARIPVHVPSARFAAETALLRTLERESNTALFTPRAPTVLLSHLARDAADAARAVELGARTIKLKIGRDSFDADLARIAAVRAAIGPAIALRLDANQQRTTAPAELLHAVAAFSPELIEEPGPPARVAALEHTPVPIAFDESLATPLGRALLAPLAKRGLLAAVILKPMLLGGMFACLELAQRAQELGLEPIVTHCFDGPIALDAATHLAHTVMSGRYAAGLEPGELRS